MGILMHIFANHSITDFHNFHYTVIRRTSEQLSWAKLKCFIVHHFVPTEINQMSFASQQQSYCSRSPATVLLGHIQCVLHYKRLSSKSPVVLDSEATIKERHCLTHLSITSGADFKASFTYEPGFGGMIFACSV